MNLDKLRKILEIVDKMNLAEIELEMEDLKLKLKKPAGLSPLPPLPTPSISSTLSPVGQPAFPVAAPAGLQTPVEPPAEKIKIESRDKLVTVRSPIIGTFYRSPSPDADPYVKVGDMVSKGQVLCIVEAMKIMNEIESEYDGRIISILVENEQPVEYDQELFLIEPK